MARVPFATSSGLRFETRAKACLRVCLYTLANTLLDVDRLTDFPMQNSSQSPSLSHLQKPTTSSRARGSPWPSAPPWFAVWEVR